ncbi:MAG: IS200/IS605 family transposase [Chloracidobacterium sp.]|nr:IS200/IS605 family transposase [Chloracidobacterium sp.]
MPHTYTNLLFHIVFSTKERYPFILPEFEERLYDYIGGTIRGIGGICLEIGGMADHIHMVVVLRPTLNVSKFLEKLKPSVTNWARTVIHPKFEWQDGYGAFSIGESQIPGVRKYLQNQKEHHKKQTFEDEFKTMLAQAGIEFDARYLWK